MKIVLIDWRRGDQRYLLQLYTAFDMLSRPCPMAQRGRGGSRKAVEVSNSRITQGSSILGMVEL